MSDPSTTGKDHYDDAGDGQCCAIKLSDDERCTNGVYGNDMVCGTHKRTKSDLKLAPAQDDRKWRRCPHCGWQPANWDAEIAVCSWCESKFPMGADRWQDLSEAFQAGDRDV